MTGSLPPMEAESHGAADADLVALADELLEQARALRSAWQQLDRLLAQWGEDPGHAAAAVAPGPEGSANDAARLMAMELAREGRSRAETAEYLEQTFGLRPDEAMLDEMFS